MYELIEIASKPKNRNVVTLPDPFKENLENSQPTMTHDGSRSDNGDIQALGRVLGAKTLAFKLCAAIRFAGRRGSEQSGRAEAGRGIISEKTVVRCQGR